ncbi:MAG: OmpH family outer membrane protein [Desulfomicrobium escambiense]|nr:OmpH family outer membrane protein [Desulfomicrobium escambiense]
MKILKPWSKDLEDIIKAYGEKNNIDLILDKTNPVVIYAIRQDRRHRARFMEHLQQALPGKAGQGQARKSSPCFCPGWQNSSEERCTG